MFTAMLYVHVGTRDISASQLDEDLFTTEKAKTKKKMKTSVTFLFNPAYDNLG